MNMGFSKILGQDSAVEILRRIWQNRRDAAFLLFLGPAGVGRRWTAALYAQALLCRRPDPIEGGCGDCDSCGRALRGVHPDFCRVDFRYQEALLDKKASDLSLGINTFRKTVAQLRRSPMSGERSICLVDGAEALTLPAQVSLLKVLEESPRHLHWLWVADSESSLLDTILSRVNFKIYFRPLENHVLTHLIADQGSLSPDRAERIALISGGSLKRARQLLEKKGAWEPSLKTLSFSEREAYELSARLARFKKYPVARAQVEALLEEFHYEALAQWRKEPIPQNLKRLEAVLEAQSDLDANLTPPLVLERLLLGLSGL